jgi:hypothetical protein
VSHTLLTGRSHESAAPFVVAVCLALGLWVCLDSIAVALAIQSQILLRPYAFRIGGIASMPF